MFSEAQACEIENRYFWYTLARQHDLEVFPHTGGGDQMFQLQRDLGLFLGQLAIFESVSKLIFFSDTEQELRLRYQWLHLKTALLCLSS